jgi:hypothetical protein
MNKSICKILINDIFDELKEENKRLLNDLSLAQKRIKLFEKYRNCLNSFDNNCNCDQNIGNKLLFKNLEKEFECVFNSAKVLENKKNIKTIDNKVNDIQSNDHKNNDNLEKVIQFCNKLKNNNKSPESDNSSLNIDYKNEKIVPQINEIIEVFDDQSIDSQNNEQLSDSSRPIIKSKPKNKVKFYSKEEVLLKISRDEVIIEDDFKDHSISGK